MATKSGGMKSQLAYYLKIVDYLFGLLLIGLGVHLYFVGFEDVRMLIWLSSFILISYGIKMILGTLLMSIMGKEIEKLIK